jgi:ATP-dependent helicase/nuclease subunit B
MHEDIFRDLARGATLITVNALLARFFAREFHAWQKEQGRTVWRPPDVLPLDSFLNRCWTECVWGGSARGFTLLSPLQEQVLWEQVIRASPSGETLLRIPETARSAAATWSLVQAYRLPLDGRFEGADDWAAFAGWSRDFEKRCRAGRWLDRARLTDFIADRFLEGAIARPAPIYLSGFDEIPPQHRDFLTAIGETIRVEPSKYESVRRFFRFEDARSEIAAAADWAWRALEHQPDARIGIIVPDLQKLRTKIDRGFRDLGEHAYHVSLGSALAESPSVHAASLILQFGLKDLPLPSLGVLLRSPFLGGYESEWTLRGLLDARLRRKGMWDVDPSRLRDECSELPDLARRLARFAKLRHRVPSEQRPSEWCHDFGRLLDALGWPGDRALNSRECQLFQAWRDLLSDFAALDVAMPLISYDQALSRLREIASARSFQVEDEGAPVQIMGLLEASGLNFDHLWIIGLNDEALPFAATPNPFLPISLQRDYGLPHSSAELEIEFARRLIQRLVASAPDVVMSYPASDGDRTFNPSALIAGAWQAHTPVETRTEAWVAQMRANASFEEVAGDIAPMIASSEQSGGASIFRDMAACPFRAFARHRLSARPLEETMPGLSYRDRGNTVHRAMQVIWSELQSQARLLEIAPDDLRDLISRAASIAANSIPHSIGRVLEQRRLERLLADWLKIEKSRPPFSVRAVEADRLVSIGGLEVKTRADRIDALASGSEVILDYKTGKLSSKAWESDRPDDPQLPLYCATSDRPVAAVAFAQIRVGELGFQGLAETGSALPTMTRMRSEEQSLHHQVARWREVLERLAEEFRDGRADVDPKPKACEHCGLWGLCRIREVRNA